MLSLLPNSRTELVDPNTGIISNVWYRFFSSLISNPKFRAYRSTNYTLTGVTDQVIPMDTVEYDTSNGDYNPTTGIWTPSRSGVYVVSAGAYLITHQTTTALIRLMIFENGVRVRYFVNDEPPSTSRLMANSDLITITAGKQYDVRVTVNTAASQFFGGSTGTWFSAAYQP